jgi:hypothetical protein
MPLRLLRFFSAAALLARIVAMSCASSFPVASQFSPIAASATDRGDGGNDIDEPAALADSSLIDMDSLRLPALLLLCDKAASASFFFAKIEFDKPTDAAGTVGAFDE